MAKFNMDPHKSPIPTRDAEVRAHDFFEVATGYDEATAINEALRCLGCKNMPCAEGCPVAVGLADELPSMVTAIDITCSTDNAHNPTLRCSPSRQP